MSVTRRQVLTVGAVGVGIAVAGSLPVLAGSPDVQDEGRSGHEKRARPAIGPTGRPFPPLRDDPDGILALPPGFRYRVVTRAGQTSLDGGIGKTPGDHDGTAVFPAGRTGCG